MPINASVSVLKDLAKSAAINKGAEIALSSGLERSLIKTGAEVVEHSAHHLHANPLNSLKNVKVSKQGLKSGSVSAVNSLSNMAQTSAGLAHGLIGEPAINAVKNTTNLARSVGSKALTFDEHHGVHLSNYLGNRIVLAGAVGAGVMTAGTMSQGVESQYQRSEPQEKIDRSLGAHGGMVIDGHKAARKRY